MIAVVGRGLCKVRIIPAWPTLDMLSVSLALACRFVFLGECEDALCLVAIGLTRAASVGS